MSNELHYLTGETVSSLETVLFDVKALASQDHFLPTDFENTCWMAPRFGNLWRNRSLYPLQKQNNRF